MHWTRLEARYISRNPRNAAFLTETQFMARHQRHNRYKALTKQIWRHAGIFKPKKR